jgi:hypothetical protein
VGAKTHANALFPSRFSELATALGWIRYKWGTAPPTVRRAQMPTYIMLTTLTPEGVQTIKNNPARIR